MGNTVKFSERGHVLIRVLGFEAEPGQQKLHIVVEDTGIGIWAEDLERIFEEFNQVEDQANRSFEGTGLGLTITRRLVEQMGARSGSSPKRGSAPVSGSRSSSRLQSRLRNCLYQSLFRKGSSSSMIWRPTGIFLSGNWFRQATEWSSAPRRQRRLPRCPRALPEIWCLTDHLMPGGAGLICCASCVQAGMSCPSRS